MPENFTIKRTAAVAPVIRGDPRVVTLTGWGVKTTPFGKITEERYETPIGQEDTAREFMAYCLANEQVIDCERKIEGGSKIYIDVTLGFDIDNPTWTPGIGAAGQDLPLFDFDVIDTSVLLSQHPYFGCNSALSEADRTMLAKEMGACDQLFATGKHYALQDNTASQLVQMIMARYAGLRAAGTDEYNPIMVALCRRSRLFKSEAVRSAAILTDINRIVTISDYNLSAFATTIIAGLKQWTYNSQLPEPEAGTTSFTWVKLKPVLKLSGNNPNGPYDVAEYFLGIDQAAKVLYPPANGATGGWDPQYDITQYATE